MFILETDWLYFIIPSQILNLAILTPEDLVFESEIALKTKWIDRKVSNTDSGHLQIIVAFSRS